VIDAWFDSGSMPAAQIGYPHAEGSRERLAFPADFISEAIDQTRGWFYSLLAVNVLVFGSSPYRHVVCLGHLVDDDGRKMSKSLGNVIDPWEVLDTQGADPMRWWMFSQGSPWTPTRASMAAIEASTRETLRTLWNTLNFFTTYASLNGFDPAEPAPEPSERPELDRWALSRLDATVSEVTEALTAYEPLDAATTLARLVDDLSNWFVRRSRRRFWRTDPDAPPEDAAAAHATLYEALHTVSLLLAPFCPFVADRMWRVLTGAGDEASVHLESWPEAAGRADPALDARMAQARRLSSLGRAARGEANVKVRQPLRRALVHLPAGAPPVLDDVVSDELNVDEVVVADDMAEVLSFELVPNYTVLGPRLRDRVQQLRAALGGIDVAAAAATLEGGGTVTVDLAGGAVELGEGDVELRVQGQAGFAVSREGGEVVALDLELDDDLRRRGLVREVVRQIQDLRKACGLEVSDRITLRLAGLDDLADSFGEVAREVLAVEVITGADGAATPLELEGYPEARASVTVAAG
jgi:isoleucyl-tRNA synthetase